MCGRAFLTYSDEQLYLRFLSRGPWPWQLNKQLPSFQPNYNLAPTQKALVLRVTEGTLGFCEMRWGLVPSWAKSVADADKYSMINARAEEIMEKRSYKSAFQKRRCIFPVSGFFEWQKTSSGKKPFAVQLKDEPLMAIAGIWEHWSDKESGATLNSFALLTTSANFFMSKIHDRMPVILNRADEQRWLDPDFNDTQQLSTLMKPCPDEWLQAFEVSTLVNSPKNNRPELLKQVT